MTSLAALSRVKLTASARAAFPDIGPRDGIVQRVETGWAVVHWKGMENTETRLPAADLEEVTP